MNAVLENQKIELTYEPRPMCVTFATDWAGKSGLLERINSGKKIYVSVSLKGKTQVTVSLMAPNAALNVSTYNSPTNPFKMVEKVEHNWYTGNYRTIFYFKLTKKTGLKQFEVYIKDMLSNLFPVDVPIKAVIWENSCVNQIRSTYPGV
jgi:hypothetical protein